MYLRAPQLYRWAGVAALTSASVGRAMMMLRAARFTGAGLAIGLWGGEVEHTLRLLGRGNRHVRRYLLAAHLVRCRRQRAIEAAHRQGRIDEQTRDRWRSVDLGRRSGDAEAVWQGNRSLLEFEQRVVLQNAVYNQGSVAVAPPSGWMPSPLPLHAETFETWNRRGNPARFEDRSAWIQHSLLPRYRALARTTQRGCAGRSTRLPPAALRLLPLPVYGRPTVAAA